MSRAEAERLKAQHADLQGQLAELRAQYQRQAEDLAARFQRISEIQEKLEDERPVASLVTAACPAAR